DEAKKVADGISDPQDAEAKALAQLELILVKLENTTDQAPLSMIEESITSKDSLAYGLALETLARHNTRLGHRSEALALAAGARESSRAFVQIGVALGMMDAAK